MKYYAISRKHATNAKVPKLLFEAKGGQKQQQ